MPIFDVFGQKYNHAGAVSSQRLYLFDIRRTQNDPLYLVGHLPEFHSFLAALRELKDFKEDEYDCYQGHS